MPNLRGLGLLSLVAFLGFAGVGSGGTRLDGHGVLFVRQDPGSPTTGVGPIYVWQPGSRSSKLSQSQDPKSWVQWSPDGKQIAFVAIKGYGGDSPTIGNTGDIWVASAKDIASAKQFTQVPACNCNGDGVLGPSWSPDSRQIVYVATAPDYDQPDQLRLLTLKTSKWRPLHVSGDDPAWGPGGIAYFSFGRPGPTGWPSASIRLLNPKTDRWKPFASTPGAPRNVWGGSALAWSRSDQLAALERRTGRLVVIYSASGRPIRRFLAPQTACSVTWSPDGKHLLITAGPERHSNYWHVYEVDPAGRHWHLTPIRPSDCTTSWR